MSDITRHDNIPEEDRPLTTADSLHFGPSPVKQGSKVRDVITDEQAAIAMKAQAKLPEWVDPQLAGLSARQLRFCHEYVIDFNAKKAAIRAGYAGNSYIQQVLLTKPYVRNCISRLLERRMYQMGITKERVLLELGRIGFSDLRDIVDLSNGNVTVKDFDEMGPDAAVAIKSLVTDADGNVKVVMHDKMGALKKLADHLGTDAVKKVESKHEHVVKFKPVMGVVKQIDSDAAPVEAEFTDV